MKHLRHLVVVLGDQLDRQSAALDDFDPQQDAIWMAESAAEAAQVWSTKQRIAVFFAAMRHYRDDLRARGWTVHYRACPAEADDPEPTLLELLAADLRRWSIQRVRAVMPGEWRLREGLCETAEAAGLALDWVEDRHFLCSVEAFQRHAHGRKQLRMEYFYREMRRRYGILLTTNGQPEGGAWNFDQDNRASFDQKGPGEVPTAIGHPDAISAEVIELVNQRFADHPGTLRPADFVWPVTPDEAEAALEAFIGERLPDFGRYQDAMWTAEPFLYHSRLSVALNLKLIDPRRVIEAAEAAYDTGQAPLNAVEGFIRQILGWREYVRGIYWTQMPGYLEQNFLAANAPLPDFYWTGETAMRCLREAIGQTLQYGYAHHIQRLMVTGLYALLLGVKPAAVHAWYLAVYVDAVEWVELPNTLGMSQFGDGGLMASKPYVATGKYLQRMSNYCAACPFDPAQANGPQACPYTTLYWDFLERHRERLQGVGRMRLQLRNVERKSASELKAIRARAAAIRQDPSAQTLLADRPTQSELL